MSLQNDYTKSHPLDIRLLNDDHEEILYISNDLQSLSLEITNISDEPIEFKAPESGQSADDFHHLNLNFKPDTLNINDSIALAGKDWSMGIPVVPGNNSMTVALQSVKALVLQPFEKTYVSFTNLSANSTLGSRVTQVQIQVDQLYYASNGSKITSYFSTVQLSIINQRGKKNIPLHFGFAGSNTVLNDGTTGSELNLQITNTATENQLNKALSDITFNLKSESGPASYFTFSFTPSETNLENSLADASDINAISIAPPTDQTKNTTDQTDDTTNQTEDTSDQTEDITSWQVRPNDETNNSVWTMYPNSEQVLSSGEFLNIPISNIITNAKTGMTYLKVSYFNIPGYWDGDVLVPIMKQPLVMRSITADTNESNTSDEAANTVSASDDATTANDPTGSNTVDSTGNQVGIGVMPTVANIMIGDESSDDGNLWVKGHIKTEGRIADKAGAVMPKGGIIMWSGSSDEIPVGWLLCDGKDDITPDLRNQFIVGAGTREEDYESGESGGHDRIPILEPNLPRHTHEIVLEESGEHSHYLYVDTGSDGDYEFEEDIVKVSGYKDYVPNEKAVTDKNGKHTHNVAEKIVGGNVPIDIRPRYYALCFIMKL